MPTGRHERPKRPEEERKPGTGRIFKPKPERRELSSAEKINLVGRAADYMEEIRNAMGEYFRNPSAAFKIRIGERECNSQLEAMSAVGEFLVRQGYPAEEVPLFFAKWRESKSGRATVTLAPSVAEEIRAREKVIKAGVPPVVKKALLKEEAQRQAVALAEPEAGPVEKWLGGEAIPESRELVKALIEKKETNRISSVVKSLNQDPLIGGFLRENNIKAVKERIDAGFSDEEERSLLRTNVFLTILEEQYGRGFVDLHFYQMRENLNRAGHTRELALKKAQSELSKMRTEIEIEKRR